MQTALSKERQSRLWIGATSSSQASRKLRARQALSVSSIDVQVIAATVKLNLDDKDYKKTKKFTWLASAAEEKAVPIVAVEFEPLITKEYVAKV